MCVLFDVGATHFVIPEPAAFVAVHRADNVVQLVEYRLRGFAPIHFAFAVNDRRRKERRLIIRRRRRVSVARCTLWASVARAFGDVGHLVL